MILYKIIKHIYCKKTDFIFIFYINTEVVIKMVYTRNQKRKQDEINTNDNNCIENLQINNTFSNVRISKRKRIEPQFQNKISQTEYDVVDESEETNLSIIPESFTNENILETETEISSGIEQIEQQTNETETEISSGIEQSEEVERKYENIITRIIQNILEKFIKKYDKDQSEEQSESEDEEYINKPKDEYDQYLKHMGSIYDGNFFTRVSIDDRKSKLKSKYTIDEIKNMNEQLKTLNDAYKSNAPNITDILNMDIDIIQKQKLLEKVYQYSNSEILSPEYTNNLKFLTTNIKQYQNTELQALEQEILKSSENIEYSDNYKEKILRSKMSFENKVIAYKRLEVMESFEATDTSEYSKYKAWMDILLSIPYQSMVNNKINETKNFIKNVRTVLDKRLSFLERPKDQVLNIVTQMIRNPDFTINAIGLHGPKGVGKTFLVKSISEALGRPYRTISLGGESDSSLLTGHGFTYVGSCPGRIIEILRETKCTNPIILFDELDKVSETHHGKEIIGNLIHLTDSTTNNKYNYDKYFSGLEFDLSKVLFIFTYNDASKVDPILADRLFKIRVDNYSIPEKMEITKKHLINTIFKEYCFTNQDIRFEESAINYIVESSRSDQGMRDIKRKFEIVISRVNTLLLTDPEEDIIRLKYKKLYSHYKQDVKPVKILREHIDVLLSDSITEDKNDSPPPGMYI